MPRYDYECEQGHVTEEIESIKAEPRKECPREDCKAPARRKIGKTFFKIGGGGVHRPGFQ